MLNSTARIPDPYSRLTQLFTRIGHLDGCLSVLDWDQATMMPDGGADARAGQLSELRLIRHEILCSQEISDLLAQAEEALPHLNDWQQTNLARMRRAWRHATALPAALVEALSRAACDCEMKWRNARKNNNFKSLVPDLDGLLQLSREAARAKGALMGCTPYVFSPTL